MLSILARMNPAVCLGGASLSTVHEDDSKEIDPAAATDESSQESHTNGRVPKRQNARRASSFGGGCLSPRGLSRYQPDDVAEPFPSDAVLRSLGRTVPGLLARISSPPPATADGAPSKEARQAVREFKADRTEALQRLYCLTKKGSEHNRVPLVCNPDRWDLVGALSAALLASAAEEEPDKTTIDGSKQSKSNKPGVDEDRRLILWSLNNLSIPYENKFAIALGEHSSKLLQALTTIIQSNFPETYLCCICLNNLTFLADAIRPVTFYVPPSYGNGRPPYSPSRARSCSNRIRSGGGVGKPPTSPFSRSRSLHTKGQHLAGKNPWLVEGEGRISEVIGLVLGNSSSLIRVVERMLLTNAPFIMSEVQSVEGEAVRWAFGFVRNITYAGEANASEEGDQKGDSLSGSSGRRGSISDDSIEEICSLVSRTEIPRLMVQFVGDSPREAVEWTKDSLEDICLGAMCSIAQWQPSSEALKRAGAVECLERIEGLPGIHGYRARAIRCSLGALPMQFG